MNRMFSFPPAKGIPYLVTAAITLTIGQTTCRAQSDSHQDPVIQKIAFGSCFNPRDGKAGIFEGILKHKPDVFVFLGDNIYGDTEDMELLRGKYAELEAVEGFRRLRESTALLATWDDHDYGINDGGKSYPKREESERVFLDFFKVPDDSPRRQRPGVYGSHTFGKDGKVCQILLLDTRYFRDELARAKRKPAVGTVGWYEPTTDTSMTLLGEAQWQWLEQQLKVPADLRIIASSIQMLADEKGMENWGNVPHERSRLFDLLKKHKAHHTFAISGDVHFAELSKTMIGDYPFYDLTSSGMSRPHAGWANAVNTLRVGRSHPQMNAGLITIDWDAMNVELSIIGADGGKIMEHPLKLSELKF